MTPCSIEKVKRGTKFHERPMTGNCFNPASIEEKCRKEIFHNYLRAGDLALLILGSFVDDYGNVRLPEKGSVPQNEIMGISTSNSNIFEFL